jgi:hypothetical protein
VFLMRRANGKDTHPRDISAIDLWKKQKLKEGGPPAVLERKETNAKSSDLPASHTNECHQDVITNAMYSEETLSEGRRERCQVTVLYQLYIITE